MRRTKHCAQAAPMILYAPTMKSDPLLMVGIDTLGTSERIKTVRTLRRRPWQGFSTKERKYPSFVLRFEEPSPAIKRKSRSLFFS